MIKRSRRFNYLPTDVIRSLTKGEQRQTIRRHGLQDEIGIIN